MGTCNNVSFYSEWDGKALWYDKQNMTPLSADQTQTWVTLAKAREEVY